MSRWALIIAAGLVVAGCGIARTDKGGDPACPTYEEQVRPVLERHCVTCHGEGRVEGGYRLDDWARAVERRDDGSARIEPGDRDSAFLAAVRGEGDHVSLGGVNTRLMEDWVVRCKADVKDSRIHPRGWVTPTAAEFHGAALRATSYDYSACTKCHGDDLRGGNSGVDCQSCHQAGVSACNTCHGSAQSSAPPKDLSGAKLRSSLGVGAHQQHLQDGPLHEAYDCSVCHLVPDTAAADGHYREDGGTDLVAEVSIARSTKDRAASWTRANATCSDSYCHAPSPTDASESKKSPVWTGGAEQAACGSCHGIPPTNHPGTECQRCHGAGYLDGGVSQTFHANGVVDFGGKDGDCSACHGSAENAAPPRDLQGRSDATVPTVGAHQVHLEAGRLRGPIACNECHLVPTDVHAPGHLDSSTPAEVFPAGSGVLARADGANPTYDAQNATCGSVYCHGNGTTKLADDQAPGLVRTPTWTGGVSQIQCGGCHGIPPKDTLHPGTILLNQCVVCHSATMDSTGRLKLAPNPVTGELESKHIDGTVQTD